ncbi:MAG: phosphatase PAP2 family protein [Deltaproteobacteria bacterium]|nr:phosphatase PAP2 family protein [Deltaproteobacteria bacterium]
MGSEKRGLWVRLTTPWGTPPPERYDWRERIFWLVVAVSYYLFGWFVVGKLVAWRGVFYDLSLPIDHRIPLWVGFSWGYASIFGLIALIILLVRDREIFLKAARGFLIQSSIAFVVFILVPVRMVGRPDELAGRMEGVSAALTAFFYSVDPPLNLFPSMHLCLGVFSGLVLIEDRPALRWPVYAVILWIALSVLFVRQHYLLDAVAGTAMALFFRWWLYRRPARRAASASR